jgi:hypothetical protein
MNKNGDVVALVECLLDHKNSGRANMPQAPERLEEFLDADGHS